MNNNAVDPVQGLRWGPRCNLDRYSFVQGNFRKVQ